MRALGIGRWASLTGVASVAAFVASALAVGFYEYLPAAVEIESFLESNSSRVAVGGYLGLYGSLLLLVWVSLGLRTSMGGAEGGDRRITVVAYAGGVTAVMIAMVAYAALIAAAARAGESRPGQAPWNEGQLCAQGRARSKAWAACSTRSSRWRGPTIWSPTGSPARERPARTVAAGCQEMLKGIVKLATPAGGCTRPSVASGKGPLAGGGS